MRIYLLLFCCCFLIGCASNYKSASEVSAATKVISDPYTKTTSILGSNIDVRWPRGYGRYKLAGGEYSGGYLVVLANHLDWAFLDSAIDRDSTIFPTEVMERKVEYPWCREIVRVKMSKDYLQKATKSGIDVKIMGKGGDIVVVVPAHYVEGFLLKMEGASR